MAKPPDGLQWQANMGGSHRTRNQMKIACLLSLACILLGACTAASSLILQGQDLQDLQDKKEPQKEPTQVKMAFYHLGYLKRGPKQDEVLKELGGFKLLQIHKAHEDYLDKLARSGRLMLCGRFLDRAGKDPTHHLVLFLSKACTEEQAYLERHEIQKLMATDPLVSRGVLRLELHLWQGPAGITYPGRR